MFYLPLIKDGVVNNKIERLNPKTKKWTFVGQLQTAREDHTAIFYDSHFLVTGGDLCGVSLPTEICVLANDQVTCKSTSPTLYNFGSLETFIVPFDFCQ